MKQLLIKIHNYRFRQLGPAEFELVQDYSGVPIVFFLTKQLLKKVEIEVVEQAKNTAQLPGLVGQVCIMPDTHVGYGAPIGTVFAMDPKQGYVSPGAVGFDINCGVRLIKTSLMEKDVLPFLEKLVNKLYCLIPAGLGLKGHWKVSHSELKQVVEKGAPFVIKQGYGLPEDEKSIEAKGQIKGADIKTISQRAQERGLKQLGTLGSGNHYLEIQKVEQIYSSPIAKKLGIETENQIVIMVHCGSRGLGHQVCGDYQKIFQAHSSEYLFNVPDKQLIAAPLNKFYAQNYLSAMAGAANYAFANRQVITHKIREGFVKVFHQTSEQLGLDLIYDVAHNIAKYEKHIVPGLKQKSSVLVHRKGATRSFPNQPVIIGGSMQTSSYLLMGTETALQKSFGSTCHGAGRVMSRRKAKQLVQGQSLEKEMKQQGIYVKTASYSGLAEEASLAYKNIDQVIQAVKTAGLSKPVLRLKPLGNIKG